VSAASKAVEVNVDGRVLKLTNLDKVLWPEVGFTKGQMIDYYTRIAPALLPHLKDRPLTLKRYPNGVDGEMFYEKNCPAHRPPWIRTAKVWSDGNNRWMYYCLVQDLPSLVWVAQLGTIELHTSLSLYQKLSQPRMLVFDLDPGPPATIVDCCEVAQWLRAWFQEHDLQSFCKTSGSKGLQVYVPLNREITYAATKPFAKAAYRVNRVEDIGRGIARAIRTAASGRPGGVYLDIPAAVLGEVIDAAAGAATLRRLIDPAPRQLPAPDAVDRAIGLLDGMQQSALDRRFPLPRCGRGSRRD